MRLPQIQSQKAVMLIAAAITIVTWMVVIWPGTDTRKLPSPPPVTYVDMNMKERPQNSAPTPAP